MVRITPTIDRRLLIWGITGLLVVCWLIELLLRDTYLGIEPHRAALWLRSWCDELYLFPSWGAFLRRPWTILSYAFMHKGWAHLLLNLLLLHFFGRMLLETTSVCRVAMIYLGGAVVGGSAYLLIFGLLRLMGITLLGLPLVGASAAILSLASWSISVAPKKIVLLPLVGGLRRWQVGVIVLGFVLFAHGGYNVGGLVAHLAGILYGLLGGSILRNHTRLRLVRKRRLSERYLSLLQKAQQSGYQSLTPEERDQIIDFHRIDPDE